MRLQLEQVVRSRRPLDELEQRGGAGALELGRRDVVDEAAGRRAELLEPLLERRALAELEHELPSGGAERLVDPGDHPAQAPRAVGREQLQPVRVAVGAEPGQRLVERLAREHRRLRLVELAEARVEPGLERIRLQQPIAEAVDRRDPGAVERPRQVVAPSAAQLPADARAQLPGGALRVGDDEDRLDVDAVVADRADEALDQHRGLPRPGPGGDEHAAGRLDRRALLGIRRPAHARSTRHIGQRSHQDGHSPPFGSWRTSPERIRSASCRAVPRAVSTWAQKASSSR